MKPNFGVDRRTFLEACGAGWCWSKLGRGYGFAAAPPASGPVLRLDTDSQRPLITMLSWDTEGGERVGTNLLRRNCGVGLRLLAEHYFIDGSDLPTTVQTSPGGASYALRVSKRSGLRWDISTARDSFSMKFSATEKQALSAGQVAVVLRFDPRVTPTTVLPTAWKSDGSCTTPLIISAPDFGQMLMRATPADGVSARLEGSRDEQIIDLIVELPQIDADHPVTLSFAPVFLDPPEGLQDTDMWRLARRGWFNMFQPQAAWGSTARTSERHAGLLANNVLSDPASFSLIFYSDPALFTPTLPAGISVAALVRQTVEYWIYNNVLATGEVQGYGGSAPPYAGFYNFLDANAVPLICAWDYVEATNDLAWLEKHIARLEFVADCSVRRDQDRDGLVEANQSGNANTLTVSERSSNWFDAVNYGHKDAYSNALIYRGWRCLADLEAKLHRDSQQAHYSAVADRLQGAYARALLNPRTGWIAEWKSADGVFHDHASPVVNGLAVGYGLVSREQGGKIIDLLWAKMRAAGFTRFDLGIPCCLEPVPRADYMQPNPVRGGEGGFGLANNADGKDTFQHYQNGGISAGMGAHFLLANYRVGKTEDADRVLRAMLERQQKGLFQNGIVNENPKGLEWATWDGQPCGYEGYLADVYFFLMAALVREPAFQAHYFRPLPMA